MIDRVLMNASPFGNQLFAFPADAPQETRRRGPRSMTRVTRKNSSQISIEIRRPFEAVLFSLARIMLAQRNANFGKRFDLAAYSVLWPRAGNFSQQGVNVFKLSDRRPTTIATTPIRT